MFFEVIRLGLGCLMMFLMVWLVFLLCSVFLCRLRCMCIML